MHVRHTRDLERVMFARAVWHRVHHRILTYGNGVLSDPR
jgi:hypothetical protein